MQIFNVSFNDNSRMNGTFAASTYLTSWTGRWSVVGPGLSVDMRVFNNTRCFGSFARVSAQDAAMLDLTCAFLREDGLQTIDSTCKVTFVCNDFHYYLLMLLWNIAATVAFLAAAFFAAFCASTQRTAVRRGISDALRHQQLGPGTGSFHRGINSDDASDDNSVAPPPRRRRPAVAVAASSSSAAVDERTRLRANVESSD